MSEVQPQAFPQETPCPPLAGALAGPALARAGMGANTVLALPKIGRGPVRMGRPGRFQPGFFVAGAPPSNQFGFA